MSTRAADPLADRLAMAHPCLPDRSHTGATPEPVVESSLVPDDAPESQPVQQADEERYVDVAIRAARINRIIAIQIIVAGYLGVELVGMTSNRRLKRFALARHVAMYLSDRMLDRSLAEIGRQFGGRHHATVYHGIKKTARLIGAEKSFADKVSQMEAMVADVLSRSHGHG